MATAPPIFKVRQNEVVPSIISCPSSASSHSEVYYDSRTAEVLTCPRRTPLIEGDTTAICKLVEWWGAYYNFGSKSHNPISPGQILMKLKQDEEEQHQREMELEKEARRSARASAAAEKKNKKAKEPEEKNSTCDQLGTVGAKRQSADSVGGGSDGGGGGVDKLNCESNSST